MSTLIVCDLEFSGAQWVHEQLYTDPMVLDLLTGAMIAVTPDLEPISEIEFRAQPTLPRRMFSGEEIHGITYYEAMRFPDPHYTLAKIMAWLDELPGPIWFCNHAFPRPIPIMEPDPAKPGKRKPTGASSCGNIDYHVLQWFFTRLGRRYEFWRYFSEKRLFSSSALAGKFRDRTDLTDNRLDTWAGYFGIQLDHHNAKSDAAATLELLRCLRRWGNWWGVVDCEELPEGRNKSDGTLPQRVSAPSTSVNDASYQMTLI